MKVDPRDVPDPAVRELALLEEMAGVVDDDADAEAHRPLFVPGYLVRIDVAALARNLSKQHEREFLQIHAACWLVMRVGLEESPFMATDEPDWFASYEAPESRLMGDELKAVEAVPLSRLRGRGRLKVSRLRELAAAHKADVAAEQARQRTIKGPDEYAVAGASEALDGQEVAA